MFKFEKEKNKENYKKHMVESELMMKIVPLIISEEMKQGKHLEDIINNILLNEKDSKELVKSIIGEKCTDKKYQVGKVGTKLAIISACKALKVLIKTEAGRNEFANFIIKTGNELKEIKGDFEDYE
jgi:hypothetical protein